MLAKYLPVANGGAGGSGSGGGSSGGKGGDSGNGDDEDVGFSVQAPGICALLFLLGFVAFVQA